ncbi:MAG: ABC-F family ATP-binding cassette domain-containing protein [Ignavibacteriaceae bacterium]
MIDLSGISLQFGGDYLFKDVSFKINSGDKAALVGANGSGKTSLLKLLSENLQPEKGKIIKQKRTSIGYLPQDNVIHSGKSLIEEASSALSDITMLREKEQELTQALSIETISDEDRNDIINNLGEVHQRLEELESYSVNSKVEKILVGLGFEENDFIRLTNEFSGGWQMRIALAKLLISQNDLLLLDEPTNHLDLDSLEWLIDFLKNYRGALIIVSHDKHFITETTSKTYEIYNRKFSVYNGDYISFLKFKEERDQQLIHQNEIQQKKIKETQKFIERFRYKNTKAKQVQSRIKQLKKLKSIEMPEDEGKIKLNFPEPPKSGKVNIELFSIKKSYGSKVIFQDLDLQVNRDEKIAFVGANGAGKTTLAKIIAGKIDFDSGERKVGYNTSISYYAQDVADNLRKDLDLLETVDGIAENKSVRELRSILGAFLFNGDDVFKKVSVLSGGEKSRLALAKILKILQRALVNFNGSLILVSHDVDFLQPIVNKVIEVRKSDIKIFNGGIDYYLYKKKELTKSITDETNSNNGEPVYNKKQQKRIEAERRQARYIATKDIINKLNLVEKEIHTLEIKEKYLESSLADPGTYKDSQQLLQVQNDFNNVKLKLSENLKVWENLNEELQEIESKFDRD